MFIAWVVAFETHAWSTSPADVWDALVKHTNTGGIPRATLRTLIRLVFSFVVAIAVGTALGWWLMASSLARRSVGRLVTALQVIPSVAFLPLAFLWFGYTERAVVFITIVGAFPAVSIATLASLEHVPRNLEEAGRTLGARGWTMFSRIVFPAALPGYVVGLQQAWGFAWRALMAGELITALLKIHSTGLGQLLLHALSKNDIPELLAVMAVVIVFGAAVDLLVFGSMDRRIRHRRGLVPEADRV
jgi:NitT/TauT family transport system permease protein